MNSQQIQLAVSTGLKVLGPKSEAMIPVKDLDGVMALRQLLAEIATGRIQLSAVQAQANTGSTPPPPPKRGRRKKK